MTPSSLTTTETVKPDQTNHQLLTNLTEELKCPLCLELYSDPRLLLCSHTFCSNCLDQLRKRAKYNIISCPLCRHVTPVENTQISSLQRNVHLANIIQLLTTNNSNINPLGGPQGSPSYQTQEKGEGGRDLKGIKLSLTCSERELNYTKEQLKDLINFAEFNFDESRVPNIFRDWVQSLWFAPANLRAQAMLNPEIRKIWCPFWLFDFTITSTYSAKVCRKVESKEEWKAETGKSVTRYENQLLSAVSRPKIKQLIESFQDWQLHKIHFQQQKSQNNSDSCNAPDGHRNQGRIADLNDNQNQGFECGSGSPTAMMDDVAIGYQLNTIFSPSNLIPSIQHPHPVQDTLKFFRSVMSLSSLSSNSSQAPSSSSSSSSYASSLTSLLSPSTYLGSSNRSRTNNNVIESNREDESNQNKNESEESTEDGNRFVMETAKEWEECWSEWSNLKQVQDEQLNSCRAKLAQLPNVKDIIDFQHSMKYCWSPQLVYLPIYLSTFSFDNFQYAIAINGQTGQVSAQRPYGFGQLSDLCSFGFDLAYYLLDSVFVSEQ